MVPMFRIFCLSRFLTCVTIAETRLQKWLQVLLIRAWYQKSTTQVKVRKHPSHQNTTSAHS
jgi:hypothetical protein